MTAENLDRPLPNWPARMGEDLAARYLGISKSTFRVCWQSRGYPQPIREGRRLLWSRTQLDRFVNAQFGIYEDATGRDTSWDDVVPANPWDAAVAKLDKASR